MKRRRSPLEEEHRRVHAHHPDGHHHVGADVAQVDGRDAGERQPQREAPLPPGKGLEREDEPEERRDRSRAADGARRVEESRRADDAPAIGAGIRRHLHRSGVRRNEARELARHPAVRVVDLQHTDDGVDAVADEQDGENPHQLPRTADEARRPEQRAEDSQVETGLSGACRKAVGQRVQDHDRQAEQHPQQPWVRRVPHAPLVARDPPDPEADERDGIHANPDRRAERLHPRQVQQAGNRGLGDSEPLERARRQQAFVVERHRRRSGRCPAVCFVLEVVPAIALWRNPVVARARWSHVTHRAGRPARRAPTEGAANHRANPRRRTASTATGHRMRSTRTVDAFAASDRCTRRDIRIRRCDRSRLAPSSPARGGSRDEARERGDRSTATTTAASTPRRASDSAPSMSIFSRSTRSTSASSRIRSSGLAGTSNRAASTAGRSGQHQAEIGACARI